LQRSSVSAQTQPGARCMTYVTWPQSLPMRHNAVEADMDVDAKGETPSIAFW